MNNGWIKLHRSLKNNPIYKNSTALHCWIECLLRANHKTKVFYQGRNKMSVKQGQFLMSYRKFSLNTQIAVSTVHFWIKEFEDLKMVERNSSPKGTVITVLNWDVFQSIERQKNAKRTLKERKKNAKRTLVERNKKKEKNIKNEKKLKKKTKKKEKPKSVSEEKYSEFDYHLTKDFLDYQISKFPKLVKNKIKDIKNGAETIRLLRTRDGFTEDEIKNTLRFAVKDDFWRDKVLSIASIRRKSKNGNTKFQNIYIKYKNKPKSRTEQVMDIDLSKGAEIWNS